MRREIELPLMCRALTAWLLKPEAPTVPAETSEALRCVVDTSRRERWQGSEQQGKHCHSCAELRLPGCSSLEPQQYLTSDMTIIYIVNRLLNMYNGNVVNGEGRHDLLLMCGALIV